MSYSILQQILDNGFSEEEVISSLMKNVPSFARKAGKMFLGGWSPSDVLNFFKTDKDVQKELSFKGFKPSTPNEIAKYRLQQSYNNIPLSAGEQSKQEFSSFAKAAAPLAIAPIAAPIVSSVLDRALPSNLKEVRPNAQQNIQQSIQGQPGQIPSSLSARTSNLETQQPPIGSNVTSVTQSPQVLQPQGIINPKEYLEKLGIKDKVDDLLKRGNSPKQAAAILGLSGSAKKMGKAEIDPELLANIDAYSKEAKPVELPKSQETPEAKSIAKSETVATPHGVGNVREIRNGQAIIDVDGKLHKVKEDELIQSPIPQKELADLYDDLISGIEKTTGKQVSRNVEWAGYDPNTNELVYKPHGSDKVYTYEDISEEDKNLLTSLLTQRKSTGENFIGAWESGTESPIGAAMYQLIKKLQQERGGKGQEYRNRFETIYDALEPAKLAAKARYAERKKKAKKPRID